MKNILLIIFITLCVFKNLNANDNLSKLNELYLSGILDKDTYFKSLNNLGIDTSNDIFNNLFDLFSDQVIDIDSYENSINDLIKISDPKTVKNFSELNKTPEGSYNIDVKVNKCAGEIDICSDLKRLEKISLYAHNNKISIDENFRNWVINFPAFNKILREESFVDLNSYKLILSVNHIRGIVINLTFKGKIDQNFLTADTFSIEGQGRVLASGNFSKV